MVIMKCPNCKVNMKRMDHVVWECPKCENAFIYRYSEFHPAKAPKTFSIEQINNMKNWLDWQLVGKKKETSRSQRSTSKWHLTS